MSNVTVIGSSNMDMTLSMDRSPRPGETVLGGEFSIGAGGKGANQAVAAARAGGSVTLVTRLGSDVFGDQIVAVCDNERIDSRFLLRDELAATGVALIFVDRHGENSIGVASGANSRLTPADISAASSAIVEADILLIQLEIPIASVEAAVSLANSSNVPVILDPAPANLLPDALLSGIAILSPNELEAETLTGVRVEGEKSARKAADSLHEKGVGTVVITRGAAGVFVSSGDESFHIDSYDVESVDTTGAGDVFDGALAVAVAEGQPVSEAINFANAAAALSVTCIGAQPSVPSRQVIEQFLAERKSSIALK